MRIAARRSHLELRDFVPHDNKTGKGVLGGWSLGSLLEHAAGCGPGKAVRQRGKLAAADGAVGCAPAA